MRIFIATDHGGFALKEKLIPHLRQWNHEVIDCGAFVLDPEDDYPAFIADAAKRLSADPEHSRAILLGRSGQGEAMLANRFPSVRAVVWYGGSLEIVTKGREHNDANALSLGADHLSESEALEAVRTFLETPALENERYRRRIEEAEAFSRNLL